ncbi:DUF935 domain-containing protein [Candidatus Cyanaurora vandensis]|uniref:DUF935 domain-containing protein n=2 Tax=Candidatus Cyanaurora vandensis TaxID=2714958 RepID=UPI0025801C4E|nr:DUF935 family protein [Candidatus Cyanaurora vandensis]
MALILGPNDLPIESDPKKPLLNAEIATTRDGRDITRGYLGPILPPQDEILWQRSTGDLDLYEKVLDDAQVAALLQQRRLAVISRELEVIPGGPGAAEQKAADALKYNLENLYPDVDQISDTSWDQVTAQMHYGIFFGRSHAEIIWDRDGSEYVIKQVKPKNPRRFKFNQDLQLLLITQDTPLGIPLSQFPRKFWSFCSGAWHSDEPYGLALAHWLYWPTLFKRQGLKFFLVYLEKFGMPTPYGSFPPGTTQPEIKKLLSTLRAIMTDSGIVTPQGMDIKLLEASRSGSADYIGFQNLMDSYIAKLILGQMMTSEAVGGQYKADVQNSVKKELVKADADLICSSFNAGPARWHTFYNYGESVKPPRIYRRIQDEPDLKPLAERDKMIFDMGFRPTLQYVTDTYGGEWTEVQPTLDPTALPVDGQPLPTGLNGAQIQALLEAMKSVAAQELQPDVGFELLKAGFPQIDEAALRRMFEASRKPLPVPPNSAPANINLSEGNFFRKLWNNTFGFNRDYADNTPPIPETYTRRVTEQASPLVEAWVEQIKNELTQANDFDDFSERLLTLYPDLPTEQLEALLGQAFVSSFMVGRYEVKKGG